MYLDQFGVFRLNLKFSKIIPLTPITPHLLHKHVEGGGVKIFLFFLLEEGGVYKSPQLSYIIIQ